MSDKSIEFAKAIEKKFAGDDIDAAVFEVERGQKYDRIVKAQYYSRTVHAFVERSTGNLVKAAGWKAPQRNSDGTLAVRFHLDTPQGFKEALDAADQYGGYLYDSKISKEY